jgi:hypothetical protein
MTEHCALSKSYCIASLLSAMCCSYSVLSISRSACWVRCQPVALSQLIVLLHCARAHAISMLQEVATAAVAQALAKKAEGFSVAAKDLGLR